MEIQYQCNLADYAEVLQMRATMSLNRKILRAALLLLLIILCIFGMVTIGFQQGIAMVVIFILLNAFWLVRRYVLFPLWVSKDFAKHPNFSRERSLKVDNSGLTWSSEVDQNATKWPAYTRFQETQNLFVLYLGERLAEVVPKRALSGTQLREFRKLLLEKRPQKLNPSDGGSANVSLA